MPPKICVSHWPFKLLALCFLRTLTLPFRVSLLLTAPPGRQPLDSGACSPVPHHACPFRCWALLFDLFTRHNWHSVWFTSTPDSLFLIKIFILKKSQIYGEVASQYSFFFLPQSLERTLLMWFPTLSLVFPTNKGVLLHDYSKTIKINWFC